jgi:hypothetical protein
MKSTDFGDGDDRKKRKLKIHQLCMMTPEVVGWLQPSLGEVAKRGTDEEEAEEKHTKRKAFL